MLKFLSYLNLFSGIIFIAILKSNENYLDIALMVPSIFFNWVTLFHFIKNNQKFEKWHLYLGVLGVLFSSIIILLTSQILFEAYNSRNSLVAPPFVIMLVRQMLDVFVIIQFVIAYKANKKLVIGQEIKNISQSKT